MKRLFEDDEHASYTATASAIDCLTRNAVSDIIKAALKKGYSFRDIATIMKLSIDLEVTKLFHQI